MGPPPSCHNSRSRGCCCAAPLPGKQLEKGTLFRIHSWNLSPFQIGDDLSLGGGSCTQSKPAFKWTLRASSFRPLGLAGSTRMHWINARFCSRLTSVTWFAPAQRTRWWLNYCCVNQMAQPSLLQAWILTSAPTRCSLTAFSRAMLKTPSTLGDLIPTAL